MSVCEDPNQTLCYCLGVPCGIVEEAIREGGLRRVADVTNATKAGGGCRSCHPDIRDLLEANRQARKTAATGLGPRLKRLLGGKS